MPYNPTRFELYPSGKDRINIGFFHHGYPVKSYRFVTRREDESDEDFVKRAARSAEALLPLAIREAPTHRLEDLCAAINSRQRGE